MSRLDYLMRPVVGILTKKGADIGALSRPVTNLPFVLHNHSTGRAVVRRMSYNGYSPAIRYHKSRIMCY